jgi:hypothetical protein
MFTMSRRMGPPTQNRDAACRHSPTDQNGSKRTFLNMLATVA